MRFASWLPQETYVAPPVAEAISWQDEVCLSLTKAGLLYGQACSINSSPHGMTHTLTAKPGTTLQASKC